MSFICIFSHVMLVKSSQVCLCLVMSVSWFERKVSSSKSCQCHLFVVYLYCFSRCRLFVLFSQCRLFVLFGKYYLVMSCQVKFSLISFVVSVESVVRELVSGHRCFPEILAGWGLFRFYLDHAHAGPSVSLMLCGSLGIVGFVWYCVEIKR